MINLQGRESKGVVKPGKEYEELRDFIISELSKLKDPETGEKLIDKIHKREEIYSGPYVKNAPDIFILPKRGYHLQDGFGQKRLLDIPKRTKSKKRLSISGTHEMNGIFMMKGPNIKKSVKIENLNIIDVTPTILYIMGVPIPKDMDGKVLTGAFEKSFLRDNQIQYQKVKGEKDRLRIKINDLKSHGKV